MSSDDSIQVQKLPSAEEEKIMKSLKRQRVQMLLNFPFYGMLTIHLDVSVNYNIPRPAMTDGTEFIFNPYLIKTSNNKDVSKHINFLIIHEIIHCAQKHPWRCSHRDKRLWNFACDLATNAIIKESCDENYELKQAIEFPSDMLYEDRFKDMSAEKIYSIIQNEPNYQNLQREDHTVWNNSQSSAEQSRMQAEWDQNIMNAATSAATSEKGRGSIPGFAKRMIGKLQRPKKSWKTLLSEFVSTEVNDYSFNPPDTRYGDDFGFFMPDFNDEIEIVRKILFWVDTSGSVSDKDIAQVYSEMAGAIDQYGGRLEGWVGFFDSHAYKPEKFCSVQELLSVRPKGGGGTCFKAPFEYITNEMEGEEIIGIVMFTDGYCSWPNEEIANNVPVLWLITNEQQVPPWGLHSTVDIDN